MATDLQAPPSSYSLVFSDRKCPVAACQGQTLATADGALSEQRCSCCHGSFLGEEALALLLGQIGIDPSLLPQLETFTRNEPIPCPSCSAAMRLLRVRENDVDHCPTCNSLWLDSGELHRLSQGRHGEPRLERAAEQSGRAARATCSRRFRRRSAPATADARAQSCATFGPDL